MRWEAFLPGGIPDTTRFFTETTLYLFGRLPLYPEKIRGEPLTKKKLPDTTRIGKNFTKGYCIPKRNEKSLFYLIVKRETYEKSVVSRKDRIRLFTDRYSRIGTPVSVKRLYPL